MRLRRELLTLLFVVACVPGLPHIDGAPAAPSAPDRVWSPPRAARIPDSLGSARLLPRDLEARAAALTLDDAVDLALRNNPATRASWAQSRAAASAYGAARAAYWPQVNGAATAGRADQPGGSATSLTGPRTTYAPSLSLSYLLFDLGGRGGTVESARQGAFAQAYTHNRVVQTTVLQAEEAYFAYAGARALRDAQRVSVREAQASFDAARARDSVGLASIADVLQARTALAQAQLQLQTAQAQLQAARSTLGLAIGVPATTPYEIATRPEDVRVGEVTASVDSLIELGLRDRPDLQAARASAAQARAEIGVARSAALPTLSLVAGDGFTRSSVTPLSGRSYSVALSVDVPLFDGGARAEEIARTRALADVAAAQAVAQRQTVIADVFTSYYQLQAATQQVYTSDELLASAVSSLRAARARYTNGVGNIIDVLAAQSALATARAEQAQSRWNWAPSLARLGQASGALDTGGHVAVPVGATSRPLTP